MATSKQERTQQWLDQAIDELPVKVVCSNCGSTVGRYRPARVQMPSASRPAVNFKCFRKDCYSQTVVILGEIID